MNDHQREDLEAQRRFDELNAKVDANRADIQALQIAVHTTDEVAGVSKNRADAQSYRMDQLEARLDVDQEVIAVLHAEGLISQRHTDHLEIALHTSRLIGAAIGMLMEAGKVNQEVAFQILSKASQDTNRKLRDVADDIVSTGDLRNLLPV